MYKYLLFDLDGTLCDTSCGVLRSVQYALGKMGLAVPEMNALRCFIGPPLGEIFAEFCHFPVMRLSAPRPYTASATRLRVFLRLNLTPASPRCWHV